MNVKIKRCICSSLERIATESDFVRKKRATEIIPMKEFAKKSVSFGFSLKYIFTSFSMNIKTVSPRKEKVIKRIFTIKLSLTEGIKNARVKEIILKSKRK